MKKFPWQVKVLAVVLSGFLFAPCHLVVLAAEPGPSEIDHSPPGDYYPGFRLNLYADVEDDAGVRLARCYFKTKNDKNFVFVDMTDKGGGLYQAQLPAPWVNSENVEYLFVVINNPKQVTRSPLYTLAEEPTREAAVWKDQGEVYEIRLDQYQEAAEKYQAFKKQIVDKYKNDIPDWQTADDKNPVRVKTELPKELAQMEGFFDKVTVEQVPDSLSYAAKAQQISMASSAKGATASESTASVSAVEQAAWEAPATTTAASSSPGFWSGPWPWVIGGVVVAGGTAGAIAAGSSGGGDGGDGPEPCNTTTQAGGDTPETHTYSMGQSSGTFRFDYDTYAQQDRMTVTYEGTTLFDTGCVGASGTQYISYSGSSNNVTVSVQPNCAGGTGTSWTFTVYCP